MGRGLIKFKTHILLQILHSCYLFGTQIFHSHTQAGLQFCDTVSRVWFTFWAWPSPKSVRQTVVICSIFGTFHFRAPCSKNGSTCSKNWEAWSKHGYDRSKNIFVNKFGRCPRKIRLAPQTSLFTALDLQIYRWNIHSEYIIRYY